MIGNKWLSEAVHTEEFEKGTMNLVVAPTGCGKTKWAVEHLSKTVTMPCKMLLLIDTRNGNNQIVLQNSENVIFYNPSCAFAVNSDKPSFFGEVEETEKIAAMTYAKFGLCVEKEPSFGAEYQLILCDEIHGLPKFCNFSNEEKNHHKLAQARLEQLVKEGKVLIIATTATPERAEKYLHCPQKRITVDQDLRQWETKNKIAYTNVNMLLGKISPQETGIVFFSQVHAMLEFEEAAKGKGFSPICIWSKQHKDPEMNPAQIDANNYIVNKEELPPQYNMLIINASSETGINIRSHIDYIIVHTRQQETQIQVRGRYRGDLERLYLLDYQATLTVPEEFLNKKLFTEEKNALCEILALRDEYGHKAKWTTGKKRLIESGYVIKEDRENNKRYAIITS